jgi:hypothetical protein
MQQEIVEAINSRFITEAKRSSNLDLLNCLEELALVLGSLCGTLF